MSYLYRTKSFTAIGLALAMLVTLGVTNYTPVIAAGVSQGIEVTNPDSGDNYQPGDEIQIRWLNMTAGPAVTNMTIRLIPDAPDCLQLPNPCDVPQPDPYVITESTADDGAFDWNIPSNISATYMGEVQIEVKTINNTYSGTSDTFKITTSPTDPGDAHPVGSLVLGLDGMPSQGSLIIQTGGTTMRKNFPSGEVFMSHGYKWEKFVTGNAADQALPTTANFTFAPGSVIKSSQTATVYLVSANNTLRPFSSWNIFVQYGYQANMIWTVPSLNLNEYTVSSAITSLERHVDGSEIVRDGTVYFISGGVLHPYPNVAIYNSWHTYNNDFSRVVPANSFDSGLTVGSLQTARSYPN